MVTTTTAAPTTTAAAPVAPTTVASTSTSTTLADPGEVDCDSKFDNWIYIRDIEVCRSIVDHAREGDVFTPPNGVIGRALGTSLPGEAGASVLAGHVTQSNGDNVFIRLHELGIGAKVVTVYNGVRHEFVTIARETFDKDDYELKMSSFYEQVTSPEAWIMTCDGSFDYSVGHHVDNLLYRAMLVA